MSVVASRPDANYSVRWRAFSSGRVFVRFTLIRQVGFVSFSAILAFLTPSAPADSGIAARYPGDKGIGSDPDVLLFDDFENYKTAADLTNGGKWSGAWMQPNLIIDTSEKYAGNKSLQM